jgi:NADH-quinone oxidoreductase subunit L
MITTMIPFAPWLVFLVPFGAALLLPIFARAGAKIRDGFAIFAAAVAFVISCSMIVPVFNGVSFDHSFTWIPYLNAPFGVDVDPLSVLFAVLVAFFGLIIIIYSIGYMKGEEGLTRYYFWLLLFIGSMAGFVEADNTLELFIFWEMVGLCSYGLISFWYKKPEAVKAGIRVFLITRIGDVFLFAAVLILYANVGSFAFTAIISAVAHSTISLPTLTLVAFCLLGGAVAKSAQLPLQSWLFSAMEAPTSISAILHAATMVKAGVYLLARFILIFGLMSLKIPGWMNSIMWFGVLTALVGGTLAISSPDIKGVQAYSTVSQLGFMIAALGAATGSLTSPIGFSAGFIGSLYQVLSHGFFQGLNFLLIGGIIHAVGTRDMREMGGLRKDMRWTFGLSIIYLVTVIGIPPLPSFFSKELILGSIVSSGNLWLTVLIYLATACTFAYSLRYIFLVFYGERSEKIKDVHVHEPPTVMIGTCIVLAILCLGFEVLGPWLYQFLGLSTSASYALLLSPFEDPLTLIFVVLLVVVFLLAYFIYYKRGPAANAYRESTLVRGVNHVLARNYYIDAAYDGVVKGLTRATEAVYNQVETRFFDGLLAGVAHGAQWLSSKTRVVHSGSLRRYVGSAIVGIVIVLLVLIFVIYLG